jgi:hypothetical protein
MRLRSGSARPAKRADIPRSPFRRMSELPAELPFGSDLTRTDRLKRPIGQTEARTSAPPGGTRHSAGSALCCLPPRLVAELRYCLCQSRQISTTMPLHTIPGPVMSATSQPSCLALPTTVKVRPAPPISVACMVNDLSPVMSPSARAFASGFLQYVPIQPGTAPRRSSVKLIDLGIVYDYYFRIGMVCSRTANQPGNCCHCGENSRFHLRISGLSGTQLSGRDDAQSAASRICGWAQ